MNQQALSSFIWSVADLLRGDYKAVRVRQGDPALHRPSAHGQRPGGHPSLNRHTHYPCCILDGVFEPRDDGSIRFLPAAASTSQEITAIAEQVRHRVLRWFARSGLLDADEARAMRVWDNGGFSLDASERIAGQDRAGLERRLRYCARPPFALERLELVNAHQVLYRLPKPRRDGRTVLSLTPLRRGRMAPRRVTSGRCCLHACSSPCR